MALVDLALEEYELELEWDEKGLKVHELTSNEDDDTCDSEASSCEELVHKNIRENKEYGDDSEYKDYYDCDINKDEDNETSKDGTVDIKGEEEWTEVAKRKKENIKCAEKSNRKHSKNEMYEKNLQWMKNAIRRIEDY